MEVTMKGNTDFLDLSGFLIENPRDWEDFLINFSQKLKMDGAIFQKFYKDSPKFSIFCANGINEKCCSGLKKMFEENLKLLNFFRNFPENKIIDENSKIEEFEDEFNYFFNKFYVNEGIQHILISGILNNESENLLLLGLRKSKKDSFSKREKEIIKNLSPYLKIAYNYSLKIEKQENYLEGLKKAIEFEGKGIIILDKNFNVLFLNKIAETILSTREGLEITKDGLEINDPVMSLHFKKSLKQIFNSEINGNEDFIFAIPKKDKGIPLVVQVVPLNDRFTIKETQRQVLIILYEPKYQPLPNPGFLSKVFQFTPKERNIAILLTKGMDLKEISRELKISLHTVRTHLKHIYSKTNTSRQAELMKLLLSLPNCF